MECPTKEDILLHLVNDFEERREDGAIPQHLKTCSDCSNRARVLENMLDAMQQQSGRECEAVIAKLLDDLKEAKPPAAEIEVEEHLQECSACNTLRLNLNRELSYDEVMALDIPVPDSLKQRIEKILASDSDSSPIADAIDSVVERVDDLVDRITLILRPRLAPAFLGRVVMGAAQIETTSTRDLHVDVGAAGRLVKIFSENEIELDRQISGHNGTVVFKDFVPAAYKLFVEGFEIQEVNLWP